MKIKWNLFKPQGKWMYEGISEIPDGVELWHNSVLKLIDENQSEVHKGVIIGRHFHLVVELVEGSCKDDKKFFTTMFPSQDMKKE